MKGKKEKKDYDQNIGLHEVFLESVPTALIITVILVKANGKNILIIFVTVVQCRVLTVIIRQFGFNLIMLLQSLVVPVYIASSLVKAPSSKPVARTLVPLNST